MVTLFIVGGLYYTGATSGNVQGGIAIVSVFDTLISRETRLTGTARAGGDVGLVLLDRRQGLLPVLGRAPVGCLARWVYSSGNSDLS